MTSRSLFQSTNKLLSMTTTTTTLRRRHQRASLISSTPQQKLDQELLETRSQTGRCVGGVPRSSSRFFHHQVCLILPPPPHYHLHNQSRQLICPGKPRFDASTSLSSKANRWMSSSPDGGSNKENDEDHPSDSIQNQQQPSGSNLALPDRDKELALSALQSTITEHYQRGEFASALQVSKDLLKQTEQHFGQEHPATASAYNNVGLMHKLLGDFVEARSHYNVAMRIYAKVVGRDHASYAMTLHNLGSLNKSQIHFDTTLKATERLSLVETALEYLEEALEIRDAELGPEHPYTVATRSAIGSTLAAQVLHQHKMVVSSNEAGTTTSAEAARAAKRASVAATATDNGSTNGSGREILTLPTPSELVTSTADASNEESSSTPASHTQHQQRQYISLNPDDITKAQWKAAEDHLREALQTAIDNPRGKRISGIVGSGGGGSKKNHKKKGGKSKNNQQRDNAGSSGHSGVIETLSAASAGQNLAVFLKSMAMTSNPYDMSKLQEAKDLYEQVQRVRSKLLPMTTTAATISTGGHGGRQQRQSQSLHPDLYATKFSLAELLEVMGDEETANAIRQEILDTYHPGAGTGTADSELSDGDHDDSESKNVNYSQGTKQVVMVERTKANPNQPER